MANVKITQLPSATTPLTGTEVFPLVQGTTTKQVAITGLFTSPVMTNPTLGTVGQADLINATGLPIASGVSGLGAGIATFLGTPSSANLRTAVTDETGSGALVFANTPVLVAPNLGTPTFLVATNATGTAVGLTAGSAITNANLTGAVTSVGNATSLGSFTSAQLRTALTDETGAGSAVFATSPTITAPILNQINDTNNAQILGLSPTTSAVDYLVVKNGIGVGVPLHFYADGSSANIGLHIQPKGTGLVTISDGTDFNKGIRFRSSGSAASAVTLLDAVSTAGRVVTLPDATTTLVGRDTTDTLTNKTIAFSSNTFSGTLAIANGGTNASTAASAIENLLPAYAGNGSKGLRLNSGATALEWVADGGGTVTSVAATVPSFLSIAGSPITTSGTLAFTLSGTALPTTSGGTGLTSFTSGGVVYASSTSALATGSALTFDGSKLDVNCGTNSEVRVTTSGSGYLQLGQFANGAFIGTSSTDPTAGALRFGSGGSEGLRLTSTSLYTASGINVGIGTSSPTTNLEIRATSPTALFSNSATRYGYVQWENSGSQLRIGTDGAFNIRFDTNASQKMLLDSAGNLGLGVTPSAWGSGFRSLDIRTNGAGFSASDDAADMSVNAYQNSGWKFKGTSIYRSSHYSQFDGAHAWHIGNTGTAGTNISFTQAMTLDASGNLAIGTTSAVTLLTLQKSAGEMFRATVSSNSALYTSIGADGNGGYINGSTGLLLNTGGTERARIDSSGNFILNKTTTDFGTNGVAFIAGAAMETVGSTNRISAKRTTDGNVIEFYQTINVGTISITSSATAYNTSSDYRLKDNQQPLVNSGLFIDALQPKTWTWKVDGSKGVGFIAHEVQAVSPNSVVGQKDAVDENGNPIMQGMEYGSAEFIANIIAEIQSLRQRVAQLETN